MIRRADLQERVREWGLQEHVLEKDYVIGWLLWALGQEPSVLQGWATYPAPVACATRTSGVNGE